MNICGLLRIILLWVFNLADFPKFIHMDLNLCL